MFAFLGGPELLIVAAIVLLVFGSSKLPQLARSLGEAQRELKKTLSGQEDQPNTNVDTPPTVDADAAYDVSSAGPETIT